jgi:glycosyltransferase involved in cell wall biosynthesis
MNKIKYVIVDGGSSDNTVYIAESTLKKLGVKNYKIIHSMGSSIPHDRNICINELEGDVLIYWDSDVIAPSNTLQQIVKVIMLGLADIVSPEFCELNFDTVVEATFFADKIIRSCANGSIQITYTKTDLVAIHRKVFEKGIKFDEDLTFFEDRDFCKKAMESGFKIARLNGLKIYDINVRRQPFSSIYVDMYFKLQLKGIRKKARLAFYSDEIKCLRDILKIFRSSSTIVCGGFVISLGLSIMGLFYYTFLIPALWIYITIYLILAIHQYGLRRGFHVLVKLIVVNMPFFIACTYFAIRLLIDRNKQHEFGINIENC